MKYIKYLLLSIFVLISFYFTEKIIDYLDNQNPLMKEIIKIEDNYKEKPVNATIKDNTIIPGINGKEINKKNTLKKMEDFGSFNETFIIYNNIQPKISLKDNLDKIIIQGNPTKREISLILEESNLTDYLDKEEIPYSIITNINTKLTIKREYLLGEETKEKISDLNTLLNKKKINSKICLINYSNIEYCKNKKYYIITPNIDTNTNITTILTNINSGDIILIRKNTKPDNIKLILKEIKKQDLSPVYLSTLIKE